MHNYECDLPNYYNIDGRKAKRLLKAFGKDDFGIAALPRKIGNVRISRIHNFDKVGGCTYCFPHGFECTNSTLSKRIRNWKQYRKTRWK